MSPVIDTSALLVNLVVHPMVHVSIHVLDRSTFLLLPLSSLFSLFLTLAKNPQQLIQLLWLLFPSFSQILHSIARASDHSPVLIAVLAPPAFFLPFAPLVHTPVSPPILDNGNFDLDTGKPAN